MREAKFVREGVFVAVRRKICASAQAQNLLCVAANTTAHIYTLYSLHPQKWTWCSDVSVKRHPEPLYLGRCLWDIKIKEGVFSVTPSSVFYILTKDLERYGESCTNDELVGSVNKLELTFQVEYEATQWDIHTAT